MSLRRMLMTTSASAILGGALVGFPSGASAATVPLHTEPFVSDLQWVVDLKNAGVNGDTRLFAVQRSGFIRIIDQNGVVQPTPFLDISARVKGTGGEDGMAGLVFDKDYATNKYFYVFYIANGSDVPADTGDIRISRFTATTATEADPASEKVMLTIESPPVPGDVVNGEQRGIHNAGHLQRDDANYLYIPVGDAGVSANAQNIDSLLGKVLRVKPDNTTNPAVPTFTAHPNNPYIGPTAGADEIYHTGLRNPWRIAVDRGGPGGANKGDLWIADVGNNLREEINYILAGSGGKNFGWPCYEGTVPFATEGCGPPETYTSPVNEYANSRTSPEGLGCSITGGYRYRGSMYPSLAGKYVFTDWCTGRLWTLSNTEGDIWVRDEQWKDAARYVTFGEDINGELYLASSNPHAIYRVTSGGGETGEPIYRFWSPRYANAHFFTSNIAERDHLRTNDDYAKGGNWVYEGIAFRARNQPCTDGRTDVHRFWSARFGSHFYTANPDEKTHVQNNDPNWTYEGVAYCTELPAEGKKALYRFWSPVFGKHFYTTSEEEKNQLDQGDPNWDLEGIAYHVI